MRCRAARTPRRGALAVRYGCAAFLLAAPLVQAQDPDGDQPGGSVKRAAVARSSWFWRTTMEQGWDSNVRFIDAAGDPDYVSRVNSNVTLLRSGLRGSVGLVVDGTLVRYNQIEGFNSLNYDVSLLGKRRVSMRTTGAAAVFHRKLLATGVVGAAQLPLLALANQTSSGASASVEHRFSPRNSGTVDASYTFVSFDTPALVSGGAVQVRARGRRQYTSRDAVLLEGFIQQGNANGLPLSAQTVEAGWEPQIGAVDFVSSVA